MIKDKIIPIVFVLIIALFLVSGCTLPFSKSSGNGTTLAKEKVSTKLAGVNFDATSITQYTVTQDELVAAGLANAEGNEAPTTGQYTLTESELPQGWVAYDQVLQQEGYDNIIKQESSSYRIESIDPYHTVSVTITVYKDSKSAIDSNYNFCGQTEGTNIIKILRLGDKSCFGSYNAGSLYSINYMHKNVVVHVDYSEMQNPVPITDTNTIDNNLEKFMTLEDQKLKTMLVNVAVAEAPSTWSIYETLRRADSLNEADEMISYRIGGTRAGDQFEVTLHVYPSSTIALQNSIGLCTGDVKKTLSLGDKSCVVESVVPGYLHSMFASYVYKRAVVKIEYSPAIANDFVLDSNTISKYFEDYLILQDKKLKDILGSLPSASEEGLTNVKGGISSFSTDTLKSKEPAWQHESSAIVGNGALYADYFVAANGGMSSFDKNGFKWSGSLCNGCKATGVKVSANGEYSAVEYSDASGQKHVNIYDLSGNLVNTFDVGANYDVVAVTTDGHAVEIYPESRSIQTPDTAPLEIDDDGNLIWSMRFGSFRAINNKEDYIITTYGPSIFGTAVMTGTTSISKINLADGTVAFTKAMAFSSDSGNGGKTVDSVDFAMSGDGKRMAGLCADYTPNFWQGSPAYVVKDYNHLCMYDLSDAFTILWKVELDYNMSRMPSPVISPNGEYVLMERNDSTFDVYKDGSKIRSINVEAIDNNGPSTSITEWHQNGYSITDCGSVYLQYTYPKNYKNIPLPSDVHRTIFIDSQGTPQWMIRYGLSTVNGAYASSDGKGLYAYGTNQDGASEIEYFDNSQYACTPLLPASSQPSAPPAKPSAPSGPDCGTSVLSGASSTSPAWDCFVAASTNCDNANVTLTMTVGPQTSTSYLEIRGLDAAGKCILYDRHVSDSIAFPAETSQDVIDSMNAAFAQLKGKDGTCTFETADLTAMLQRWGSGSFSTGDLTTDNCQGSLFSQS